MAKQSIRLTNSAVVSALNNKADIELENSTRASAIESLANSAATTAAAATKVADAAVDLIEVQMPLKVNKSGDTFNGNVVVDGNLMVTGEINATIKGSSESAVSATKDSNGNVIVDTYLRKDDWLIGEDNTLVCNGLEFNFSPSYGSGGHIDFHYGEDSGDYSARIIERGAGELFLYGNLWMNGQLNRQYYTPYNDQFTMLHYFKEHNYYFLFGQRKNVNLSIPGGYSSQDHWTLPMTFNGVLTANALPLAGSDPGIMASGISWSTTNLAFSFLAHTSGVNRILSAYSFYVIIY